MTTILIRRCVRPGKEAEFLANYNREKPEHPDFISETLTKVRDTHDLPESMRSFRVGSENCVTYINVAVWKSAESFVAHFNPKTMHTEEIETEDRVRVVLDEVFPQSSSN